MPFFVSLLCDLGQESIFSVNLGNALLHYLRTTNEYTFAFLALQCSNKYAYLFFSYQNCADVFSYSVNIMCDSQQTAFKGHHVSICWHVDLFACMHMCLYFCILSQSDTEVSRQIHANMSTPPFSFILSLPHPFFLCSHSVLLWSNE